MNTTPQYWIDIRHPEESSPLHPTKWEDLEGPRLYLDERKRNLANASMSPGDLVFFYETKDNPRDHTWIGASAIGGLVMVETKPLRLPDMHINSQTTHAENWKVICRWEIRLRDWTNGISRTALCAILGNKPKWTPRSLMRIADSSKAAALHAALKAAKNRE